MEIQADKDDKAVKKPAGRKYSILGIVFAGLSLIILPIVFGPVGIVFGIIGTIKNDTKLGITAIILSVFLATTSAFVGAYLIQRASNPGTNSSVDSDAFLKGFKSAFIPSCEKNAGEAAAAYCTCAENYLITNNTVSQLKDLYTQIGTPNSPTPPTLTSAINACLYALPKQ